MKKTALATITALALCLPAMAQTTDNDDARYQIEERDGMIVRLDRETGAISTCERGSGDALICRASADERALLLDEIERLEAENKELRAALEAAPERQERTDAEPPVTEEQDSDWSLRLPTDEEIDRGVDALGRMMRRLGEEVESLRREWQGEPEPQEQSGAS